MIQKNLTEHLSIKQLDSKNEKDRWLVNQLGYDKSITNHLDIFNYIFSDTSYLDRNTLYNALYAIYCDTSPIGYLGISPLLDSFVSLEYALHKKERKKGYAVTTINRVSNILLDEIKMVQLTISKENEASQFVALRSGFLFDRMIENPKYDICFHVYQKTKKT